jgi:ribonuclease BN (tRNA processing enzyme)
LRLTLLGTQGWIPTPERATTCLAVDDGPLLLIFDAGTGLGRLLRPPASELIAGAREIHLFLTHYHLDHVCGLAYLPAIFAGHTLTVHVPDASLNGVDPQRGVPELIRKPYNPRGWYEQSGLVLATLHEGVNQVAGHELRLRAQCHPDTTVAYRLDDHVVLATDTVADPQTATFARGAEVLLHEAWIDGVEERDPDAQDLVRTAYLAHSSARQAAALAAQAGVGELILMHLNPLRRDDYYAQMQASAREIFASSSIYPDLHERVLGAQAGPIAAAGP